MVMMSPGCNCCGGCLPHIESDGSEFADDFSDDTFTSTSWTPDSGTSWEAAYDNGFGGTTRQLRLTAQNGTGGTWQNISRTTGSLGVLDAIIQARIPFRQGDMLNLALWFGGKMEVGNLPQAYVIYDVAADEYKPRGVSVPLTSGGVKGMDIRIRDVGLGQVEQCYWFDFGIVGWTLYHRHVGAWDYSDTELYGLAIQTEEDSSPNWGDFDDFKLEI